MAASSTTSKTFLFLESSSPHSLSPAIPSPAIPLRAAQFRGWWAQAWRDARADLKAANWRDALQWILSFLSTLLPFSCLMYFFAGMRIGWSHPGWRPTYPDLVAWCMPDGSFSTARYFQYWKISGFFQITLPFHHQLTFTQAKVVDIIWDLVVGKGGQAILAFCSWKAFSTYARSAMHAGPVTYSSFFAIFLESEASVRSTYRITRDFTTRRALRSRLAMVCIVAVMVFVLLWPTLASAMTGYTPAIRPFVLDIENNLMSYMSFEPVAYVIHDGWRINQTGDHLVSFYKDEHADGNGSYLGGSDGFKIGTCWNSLEDLGCHFLGAVSAYTRAYGFLALDVAGNLNDIETRWMNQTIGKPALNISAFYIPASDIYGNGWVDPRTNHQPYAGYSNQEYMTPNGNTTYNSTYIQNNGSCQAIDNAYQWGFSFLQLFIVTLLLLLWFIVVYTMWLKGHLDLKQRHGDEAPARFQAVLDLAEALNHELASIGEAPGRLTNRQLNGCISKRLDGGRVTVQTPFSRASGYSFRKGSWSWIKREKWWFTIAVVAGLMPLMTLFFWMFLFCIPLTLSVFLAVGIGSTTGSRVLISIPGLSISLALVVGLSSMV